MLRRLQGNWEGEVSRDQRQGGFILGILAAIMCGMLIALAVEVTVWWLVAAAPMGWLSMLVAVDLGTDR